MQKGLFALLVGLDGGDDAAFCFFAETGQRGQAVLLGGLHELLH